MMAHEYEFRGVWITDEEFCDLEPRNVFHKQLQKVNLPCDEHRDRHILFRKTFPLDTIPESAVLRITADDSFILYVNGKFAAQGPAPGYPQHTRYMKIDVKSLLRQGKNCIAVHTLYMGLINRVCVSGDLRHGLLLDLETDGITIVSSGSDFLTRQHSGYRELSTTGYNTQFMEAYDSGAPEVGFEQPGYDDSGWAHASIRRVSDWTTVLQETPPLERERIRAVEVRTDTLPDGTLWMLDFGKNYVGTLEMTAQGPAGSVLSIRCGQEKTPDGRIRSAMRCNCAYDETWKLSGKKDRSEWYDYKAFRYVEISAPEGCVLEDFMLCARHYPFDLKARLRPEFSKDPELIKIWELCVHTQKYGVQDTIQDCPDREKGFYVGDGCYTALTHFILSGDDRMLKKLVRDALDCTFITDGMVTCLDCSMMQEIAEYPLMLVPMLLWYARLTGDDALLAKAYPTITSLLDAYARDYERDGLLRNLDKWCVVEWPDNFRDGYDVDIQEGRVCREPHISINTYYIDAIRNANRISKRLGLSEYRDPAPLICAYMKAFYDEKRHIFTDSLSSNHVSIVGNLFPFAMELVPDAECEKNILGMIRQRGIHSVSMFTAFLMMKGLEMRHETSLLKDLLSDPMAWSRMLREGATTTFEAWGKDGKWNTSLFHMTYSYAALFLADRPEFF